MVSSKNVKQVIVVRNDLKNKEGNKVRTGKLIAQACHASVAFLVRAASITAGKLVADLEHPACVKQWIMEGQSKITLKVDSIGELMVIHAQARAAGLTVELIKDAGLTEFKEPTVTCLSIGPNYSSDIDKITGHLKPL